MRFCDDDYYDGCAGCCVEAVECATETETASLSHHVYHERTVGGPAGGPATDGGAAEAVRGGDAKEARESELVYAMESVNRRIGGRCCDDDCLDRHCGYGYGLDVRENENESASEMGIGNL